MHLSEVDTVFRGLSSFCGAYAPTLCEEAIAAIRHSKPRGLQRDGSLIRPVLTANTLSPYSTSPWSCHSRSSCVARRRVSRLTSLIYVDLIMRKTSPDLAKPCRSEICRFLLREVANATVSQRDNYSNRPASPPSNPAFFSCRVRRRSKSFRFESSSRLISKTCSAGASR